MLLFFFIPLHIVLVYKFRGIRTNLIYEFTCRLVTNLDNNNNAKYRARIRTYYIYLQNPF